MLRQPKKLLIAGDWHGNLLWAIKIVAYAASEGVDTIVHVGDFGWFPNNPRNVQFLEEINRDLDRYRIDLYWVDGNHEQHNVIPNKPGCPPFSDPKYHRITHLPRGYRWEWWDQTWMSLGGAHSVDRLARTKGVDWFPEERITDEQLEYAVRPGPLDVIIAHDAPMGAQIPGITGTRAQKWRPDMFPPGEIIQAQEHQRRLKAVVDDKQPLAYFHGHFHSAYQDAYRLPGGEDFTMIRGLDKDGSTVGKNTFIVTKGFEE